MTRAVAECLPHCLMAIQKILCKPCPDCPNAFNHPINMCLFTSVIRSRRQRTQLVCYTEPCGELLLASTFKWRTVKVPSDQTAILVSNCSPEQDQTPWLCLYKYDEMWGSPTCSMFGCYVLSRSRLDSAPCSARGDWVGDGTQGRCTG